MNPDDLATLEEERRFLLRSLRDLESERAAGDVDDEDYVALRDGYTKRAAGVLRSIDADRADRGAHRPARRRRLGATVATVAGVLVIAVGAGWLVARSSGERTAGMQMSGVDPRSETATALTDARIAMGTDPLFALQRFDDVLAAEPDHPEALTYRGWLLYVTLGASDAGELGDIAAEASADAQESLARAVAADPAYADPHCFLAIIADNVDNDVERARQEVDTCLQLGPPADIRGLVEQFRDNLGE